MENIEKRFLDTQVDEGSRIVSGYACLFETESTGLPWVEVIKRGAITEETLMKSDVFALFNHDEDKVLARSNKMQGSLLLELDEVGLKYTFEAPNTTVGNDLMEHIKRGEIKTSSFAFRLAPDADADKWEKRGGMCYRTIYKIDQLFDCSPVFQAAYGSTSVSLRGEKMVETSREIDAQLDAELDELKNMM